MAEEPRKLFKTISLEERLASSEYNRLPNKLPASSNTQGSPQINKSAEPQDKNSDNINIPQSQLTLPKEGIVLKGVIGVEDKQPIILKTLIQSPQALLSPPRPFDTTPLLNSTKPLARTLFASSISLQDRLKQSSVTNTTHLPQYFLTDLYTGYLTISPFSTLAISDTQDIGALANPISELTILTRQDAQVTLDGRKSENLVLLEQGTIVQNNTYKSLTLPEDVPSQDTILVAQGTFISNNIANSFSNIVESIPTANINQGAIELPIYEVAINQGITLDETTPIGELEIGALQGLFIDNNQIQGSVIGINESFQTFQLTDSPTPNISLIFDTIQLSNSPTPTLNVLGYQADRALAFGSPRIKHGTTILVVQQYLENRTQAVNDPISIHGAVVANPFTLNENDKLAQSPAIDTAPPTPNPALIPPEYSAIVGLGNSYNQGRPTGESVLENTAPSVQASTSPAADPRKDLDDPSSDTDLLTITITPEGTRFPSPIRIKAYLTAFSDGMTANWNDLKYVGRQDTLKQFTGVTRAVSFAVLMPSFNAADVTNNLNKLERIINATVVGSFNPGDNYLTGPLARLRIGGLINSYVAFSSVKWDFDPAEATFEIDPESPARGLPHLLKVSFDCAVLSTSEGRLLNGAEGNYFAPYPLS
jgi:hypothetical protein